MTTDPPDFFKLSPEWTTFMFSDEINLENNTDYNSFYKSPLENINIVLITDQLTISLPKNQRLTPQLKKIYNELDFEGYYPTKDGCLEHWTKQGIFIYTPDDSLFSKQVLDKLSSKEFIIWILIDVPEFTIKNKNHILFNTTFDSLKESGIFKKINQELLKKNKNPIAY